jgi:hypothetical protein
MPENSQQLELPLPGDKRGVPWGRGQSKSAIRRRRERERVKIHTGKPGEVIRIGKREYRVGGDGSLRRLAPPALPLPKKAS